MIHFSELFWENILANHNWCITMIKEHVIITHIIVSYSSPSYQIVRRNLLINQNTLVSGSD